MRKKLKALTTLSLVGLLLFGSAGCGDPNNPMDNPNQGNGNITASEGRPTELPNYEKKQELIFDALLGAKMNEKSMQLYSDCGYNATLVTASAFGPNIYNDIAYSNEELNRQLDYHFTLCEKYGLKATLGMASTNYGVEAHPFAYYDDILRPTLQKWKDSDTFYGYWQGDEWPLDAELFYTDGMGGGHLQRKTYEDYIDFLLDEYLYFSKHYPGKKFYHNMLGIPNGADKDMFYFKITSDDSDKYLEWYYDRLLKYMPLEDRVISYDAYPFNNYGFKDCYVGSLNDFAIACEKSGAKKQNWVQNYQCIENANMITYQYYTSMAYGFTHFITYCYSDAWHPLQYSVEIGGRPTDNYYYFQKAHRDVKTMETVYTNFCNNRIATMCFEGTEEENAKRLRPWQKCIEDMATSYSGISNVTATKDLILSVFRDGAGNDGFMLANQMLPKTITRNKVSITFTEAKKVAIWKDGKEMETIELNDGTLTIDLESGGGAFIVPLF